MTSIQYTVRGVGEDLDAALRAEARATGRSLNAVVIDTLEEAALPMEAAAGDLDWFIGSASPGLREEQEASQAWLDSLPADLS